MKRAEAEYTDQKIRDAEERSKERYREAEGELEQLREKAKLDQQDWEETQAKLLDKHWEIERLNNILLRALRSLNI